MAVSRLSLGYARVARVARIPGLGRVRLSPLARLARLAGLAGLRLARLSPLALLSPLIGLAPSSLLGLSGLAPLAGLWALVSVGVGWARLRWLCHDSLLLLGTCGDRPGAEQS
ncbi:hypothetical protein [Saccharomonospora halophila]|uniref:hypothetical protein n=1 Tax=Saccharomonospora halophila TaxID=129922 RepID=UPI0018DB296C|nr:hypothetical protein [Saccharomonospora halophila]